MSVTTDFDSLNETRFAKVVLIHKGKERNTFESWIKDDFSLPGSAEYVSPFDDLLSDKLSTVENVKATLQGSGVKEISDRAGFFSNTLKNATFTVSRWHATPRPVFDFPMTFISTSRDSDVTEKAVTLSSLIYPDISDSGFFVPPGGYRINNLNQQTISEISENADNIVERAVDSTTGFIIDFIAGNISNEASNEATAHEYKSVTADGVWFLNIGDWFIADNLTLVGANLTFSKERTKYGDPLMATVDCSFQPFRDISSDEFKAYFRDNTPIRQPVNSSRDAEISLSSRAVSAFFRG